MAAESVSDKSEWQPYYLHGPEGSDQYGGEMKVGPGHEEIAESRIDEHSIDESIGWLKEKEELILCLSQILSLYNIMLVPEVWRTALPIATHYRLVN